MKLVDYERETEEEVKEKDQKVKGANWVEKLLELRMRWKARQKNKTGNGPGYEEKEEVGDGEDGCSVDYDEREEEGMTKFDLDSFSRLLVRVPWSDAKRFSKLAFLCNTAYNIREIKVSSLL